MLDSLNKYYELTEKEMLEVTGGLAITIAGVVFTGWKAAAIIGAGVTTLAGAAGIGVWNGYKDTQDQKK